MFGAALRDSPYDFGIAKDGGVRNVKRQRELVKAGLSKTMNSRHLTGDAVDIVVYISPGVVDWDRWDVWKETARHTVATAASMGVELEWGGDWKMRDGPHFQLPRK